MNPDQAIRNIRTAIDAAPRNNYTVELHIQMIKHAEVLKKMSGREFCEMLGLNSPWAVEFNKMRKIAARFRSAGFDLDKI